MISNAKSLTIISVYNVNYHRKYMMNNNANNENSARWSTYFKDIQSFSIIVFMVSLMTAALVNTQAGMKQLADILAFFGLGYLIVGIAAQLIRMRK
jgi:hypothetical protein